jgi:excisionase family DNA binding protein
LAVTQKDPDELLSVREVAEEAKVQQQTVRRWIKDGKLRSRRAGASGSIRVVRRDLNVFLGLDAEPTAAASNQSSRETHGLLAANISVPSGRELP